MKNVNLNRRSFVVLGSGVLGLLSLGLTDVLESKNTEWDLSALQNLKAGDTFDLNSTLPSGVKKGGTFTLDPRSAQLPQTISLNEKGMIVVDSQMSGAVPHLIFNYHEPIV